MSERDITGRVMVDSLDVIKRLRGRMQSKIPYGPLREYLTKSETRQRLQEMDPEAKKRLIQQVGDEEWRRMMDDLYK